MCLANLLLAFLIPVLTAFRGKVKLVPPLELSLGCSGFNRLPGCRSGNRSQRRGPCSVPAIARPTMSAVRAPSSKPAMIAFSIGQGIH